MLENPECYHEPHRPQFHFTPLFNWSNDPNGLVYHEGEYHLFFQHNPFGLEWGNSAWGHAVSSDLLHWRQLPVALWPDERGTIWSGSGVVDVRNRAGFQSGGESPMIVAYTYAGRYAKTAGPFTQAIAYSNDRGRSWTKYAHNPVLPNQSGGDDRDPKLLWCGITKEWVMVLYLEAGRRFGLYTSPDLKEWTYTGEIQGFHECPDLFELSVDGNQDNTRWIVMGADGDYLIGEFDGRRFTTESGKHHCDHGANFYAPQTFNDIPEADGRRIQIAWMDGGRYPGMPFTQQMSFPCELALRTFPEGIRLCRNPIREIENLYGNIVSFEDRDLVPGENPLEGLSGDLLDIQMEIEPYHAKEFGLRMGEVLVRYSMSDHTITYDGATAALSPESGRIKLRALMDRTSIEVFGNDGTISLTSCYLRKNSACPDLEIFVHGGNARIISLAVHELKSVWDSGDRKKRKQASSGQA